MKDDTYMSPDCLIKLPVGKIRKFGEVEGMDLKMHKAVLWEWMEHQGNAAVHRLGWFDIKTGEYLTEEI